MRDVYAIVIERGDDESYTAYVPDLSGCVSCGDSPDELRQNIREAVALHLESLRDHNEAIPQPATLVEHVQAA